MIKILRDNLESTDNYRGSNGTKWRIVIDGKTYMVKENVRNQISNHRRHKKFRRPDGATVTGYNNSIYSEYVASNVINFLNYNNIKAHIVNMGVDEFDKKYNICEDSRYVESDMIYSFNSIYDVFNKEKFNRWINYKSIEGMIKFIQTQRYVDVKILNKYFWSMFMLDALNLNRDRHVDNWGLLNNKSTHKWVPGVLYDNGSCLLAKGDLKEIIMVLDESNDYYDKATLDTLHSLKEKDNDLKRLNYREFLSTTDNKECLEALKEFYEFLNIDWLLMFIDTLELDDCLKEYYKNIYKHSYELIIIYAYENNPNIQK